MLNLFNRRKKVLVIVGPTASGKSSLGIQLAKKYNGEVISCDSRQIYKNLEIFSGAVTQETDEGVKHHLVSQKDLGENYSADEFTHDAKKIISELHSENKLPIVVGGTGFWAKALLFNNMYPPVSANETLRETMEQKNTTDLFTELQEQDPRRAETMDPHNRRRIMRSLEIVDALGAVPELYQKQNNDYKFIFVYVKPAKEILDAKIQKNVELRVKQGLFKEASKNVSQLSVSQIEELGLGYKYIQQYLQNEISEETFVLQMVQEEVRYAKRQKTFCNKLFKDFKGRKIIIESLGIDERMKAVSHFL